MGTGRMAEETGNATAVVEELAGYAIVRELTGGSSYLGELPGGRRVVILAVESMHARGMVHGAIHGGNVIVGENGTVRLTHGSPLLYDDPGEDVKDVVGLLGELLGEGFHVAGAQGMSLRELSRKV